MGFKGSKFIYKNTIVFVMGIRSGCTLFATYPAVWYTPTAGQTDLFKIYITKTSLFKYTENFTTKKKKKKKNR